MTALQHRTRRELLTASLLLSLAADGMAQSSAPAVASQDAASKTVVAYFSRSGNTRVIAGHISRTLRADLFEIVPEKPYPEDYFATVEQAKHERDSNYEPQLKTKISIIAKYKTLFLGFPIWGETAPPVIRSFLATHDLSTATIIPFITHGGYGLGSSLSVIAGHAPQARFLEGFSLEADQERRTLEQVTNWLGGVPIPD